MSTPTQPRTRWVPLLPSRALVADAVGTSFRLDTPQGPLELNLLAVADGRRWRGIETCLAVLRGAVTEALLPKGTYHLRHPRLGVVPLFLAPCCQDEKGSHYEAWFSVLVDGA